jgi:hypothetical protein
MVDQVQGSTRRRPQPSKSFRWRAASVASWRSAIAAICASNCEMGRPADRRAATMLSSIRVQKQVTIASTTV